MAGTHGASAHFFTIPFPARRWESRGASVLLPLSSSGTSTRLLPATSLQPHPLFRARPTADLRTMQPFQVLATDIETLQVNLDEVRTAIEHQYEMATVILQDNVRTRAEMERHHTASRNMAEDTATVEIIRFAAWRCAQALQPGPRKSSAPLNEANFIVQLNLRSREHGCQG